MIKRLGVAYIHSPFGEKLAEWYSQTLGLPIEARFPGWTEFGMSAGSRFAIDHISFPSSVVQKQSIVLSFEVEDIQASVRTLVAKGVRFYPNVEKTVFDVGPALVATFEDPEGNWVQLHQRK